MTFRRGRRPRRPGRRGAACPGLPSRKRGTRSGVDPGPHTSGRGPEPIAGPYPPSPRTPIRGPSLNGAARTAGCYRGDAPGSAPFAPPRQVERAGDGPRIGVRGDDIRMQSPYESEVEAAGIRPPAPAARGPGSRPGRRKEGRGDEKRAGATKRGPERRKEGRSDEWGAERGMASGRTADKPERDAHPAAALQGRQGGGRAKLGRRCPPVQAPPPSLRTACRRCPECPRRPPRGRRILPGPWAARGPSCRGARHSGRGPSSPGGRGRGLPSARRRCPSGR